MLKLLRADVGGTCWTPTLWGAGGCRPQDASRTWNWLRSVLRKLLPLDTARCPAVWERVAGEALPAGAEPREAGEAWPEDSPRTRGELSLPHRAGQASCWRRCLKAPLHVCRAGREAKRRQLVAGSQAKIIQMCFVH